MKPTTALLILLAGISCVASHKILFFMAFASESHRNVFDPVIAELVKRGNEVTVLSSIKVGKAMPGVIEIPLVDNGGLIENFSMSFFKGPSSDDNELFESMFKMFNLMCRLTYENPEVTKMLRNPGAFKYDVMVIDAIFNEFGLALGHHLGSSIIIFSPGHRFASQAWDMNIPHPISYLPNMLEASSDIMTFWQRVSNTFSLVGFHFSRHYQLFRHYDKSIAEFIPNSPTISELENKVSFLITNTHPAFSPPMPNMPYSIEVGCVNCKPANPVPKELEDFMQTSGNAGVIYFSLGTVAKGTCMPLEMRNKVIEAFTKLPQQILWKYEADIENLPKNIKLIKWAPQQDLLAHEKIRLFITHGGSLSISEAVYHRCPVLGFPLSADQWSNMATAVQRGFAEFLDFRKFTVEEFLHKINLMLKEDRYQKAADHYSVILRDHPQSPAEKASYWIEYVARHKGAPHLKSAAETLNFFQYFLLDVLGTILLAALTTLTVIYLAIRKMYRMFCRKKMTSTKKKTD